MIEFEIRFLFIYFSRIAENTLPFTEIVFLPQLIPTLCFQLVSQMSTDKERRCWQQEVHLHNNYFGHGHMLAEQGKQLFVDVEAYGRQQDAVSPC